MNNTIQINSSVDGSNNGLSQAKERIIEQKDSSEDIIQNAAKCQTGLKTHEGQGKEVEIFLIRVSEGDKGQQGKENIQ